MAGDSSIASPDNIVCIDLTEDEPEEESLKSVRKRLQSTPKTASTKKVKTEHGTDATGAATAPSVAAVAQADATSDSSDEDVVVVDNRKAPPISYEPASASNGNDEDLQVVGIVGQVRLPHMRQHCTEKPFQSVANTTYAAQRENNKTYCEDCYCYVCDVKASECTVWDTHCNATDKGTLSSYWHSEREKARVSGPLAAVAPRASSASLAVTASHPPSGFHHRFNCSRRRFVSKKTKTNGKFCSRCYCFVCGVPATECLRWHFTSHTSSWDLNHCNATNSISGGGPTWMRLRRERLERQQRRQPQFQLLTNRPAATGPGPFAPDHEAAARNEELTKCRKCGWYNRFAHRNFEFYRLNKPGQPSTDSRYEYGVPKRDINPVGPLDWCHACGRVASERDFGKEQSEPFVPEPEDILLGTKEISFRLKSHDPREMEKFRTKWQANPEWTFDENEMRDDLFKHRLGSRPALDRILASIPVVEEDEIPNDGSFGQYRYSGSTVGATETQAVLIDDRRDVDVLLEIFRNNRSFGKGRLNSEWLLGDIGATWDSTTQKGTFSITAHIQCSQNASHNPPSSVARFLGAWFGVFPLQLSEVCGRLRPDNDSQAWDELDHCNIDVPPFVLRRTELQAAKSLIEPERQVLNEDLCKALVSREETAVLKSGAGSPILGGQCSNETDFEGMLKCYVRECLPDLVADAKSYNRSRVWLSQGVVSYHRLMTRSLDPLTMSHEHPISNNDGRAYDTIFSLEDFALATTHLLKDSKTLHEQTSTIHGMMDHLENLGHTPAPHVEGLTVELLPFQSQSLQWAIERETTPGGIQSFWWTKLPTVLHPGKELYFNFISGRFSTKKPHIVRGGIIAEQMGLGKTVISLSLILKNPAPTLPVSGSNVVSIATTPEMMASGSAFWDPGLYSRTSASQKKRGSILSRGTLVVCNVSLVGQWIDEAKSKLKDPGLVYSYHGANRKRDPHLLAQNAIVVTTYETLSSDITYHLKKSNYSDTYCAPCEQIRWWRIICDESHVLRSSNNNKSTAVLNLTADNKWLVSGTPVNTSLLDLQNQFKFLGIEDPGQMIGVYRTSTFRHVGDSNASNNGGRRRNRRRYVSSGSISVPPVGHFTFLMRSVMMRHSQKQEYAGTSTTLMSLPPKTESVVTVEFSVDDKKEYDALESAARASYLHFKQLHGNKLSKHFLAVRQKLIPLRVACAGGQVPIDDDSTENEDDEEANENEHNKKKQKAPQKLSEFAYTSKLRKLVAELERVREEDESAKSLVFSQFTSTLKWLEQELPKHGFQFRTLSGDMTLSKRSKALRDFQNDPPTTIFLLSMRAGAVGINLTQANRVFIMEPCFNPALEAQATGRVHRLGQKRNVEITRLIMKDSVETRMQTWLEKKYGNGQSEADEEASAEDDDRSDDEDKKPEAKPVPVLNVAVGSLATDKAQMVSDDFDLLFGVESGVASVEAMDTTEGDDMAVTSAAI